MEFYNTVKDREDKNMLSIKRIYEEPSKDDGYRILVDRLWARGLSKEEAYLDDWLKDIAPTNKARIEFSHEADNFNDFKKEYLKQLNSNDAAEQLLTKLKNELASGNVTLLYAAKNETMNNAVVLKEWLEDNL